MEGCRRRAHINRFYLCFQMKTYLLAFLMLIQIMSGQASPGTRIRRSFECYTCADGNKISKRMIGTPNTYDPDLSADAHLDACAKMHPRFVVLEKCTVKDPACVKTIIYGGGLNGSDLVTRGCDSIRTIGRHNPVLNTTKNLKVNRCYTEKEFPTPSPPFKHQFCICHNPRCNNASDISLQDYAYLGLAIIVIYYVVNEEFF